MKKNSKIMLAIASGLAVAGVATYFLTSDRGKKYSGKWKKSGNKVVDKFIAMMDSMSNCCNEKATEDNKYSASINH